MVKKFHVDSAAQANESPRQVVSPNEAQHCMSTTSRARMLSFRRTEIRRVPCHVDIDVDALSVLDAVNDIQPMKIVKSDMRASDRGQTSVCW